MRRPGMGALLRRLRQRWHSLRASPLVREVERRRLTYLGPDALTDLERTVHRLDAAGVPGLLVEAGCALGGSTVVLGRAKNPGRRLRVYDVFGLIPPPSDADGPDVRARYATVVEGRSSGIGGDRYYGYEQGLRQKVVETLRGFGLEPEQHGIELIEGLFQDTLNLGEPVALAHIDADWYESVMTCLTRITPWLSPGGVLVIDDYDHWSGCRRAVDEYFAGREGFELVRRARLHVVRRPEPRSPPP